MAQNWKSVVEELDGPEPRPVVYEFSRGAAPNSRLSEKHRRRKLPLGIFIERRLHGAFDGDNED